MFEGNYFFYGFLTLASAGLGSYFVSNGLGQSKYLSLKKPSFYPPNYLFGIAWSIIYLLYIYSWTQASNYTNINYIFLLNMLIFS
mgnify:CR=1 FL=1